MTRFLKAFFADQSGATAVEYGLIIGPIGVTIVAGLSFIGKGINSTFTTLGNAVGPSGS